MKLSFRTGSQPGHTPTEPNSHHRDLSGKKMNQLNLNKPKILFVIDTELNLQD
jgi:hypothetical protein